MPEPVRRLTVHRPAPIEPRAPRRRAPRGWAVLAGILAGAVLLYLLRHVLLPFALGGAVALLGRPLMDGLARRWRLPRWLTGSAIVMAFAATLALVAWWVAAVVGSDLPRALDNLPALSRHLLHALTGGSSLDLFGRSWTADQLSAPILDSLRGALAADSLAGWAMSGLVVAFGLVLSVVIASFLLISGPGLVRGAVRLLPPAHRAPAEDLVRILAPVLRRYILGVLLIVGFTSCTAWIAFELVFGLEHAATLAIIVGVLEMIPVAGPIAAALLIALAALQQTTAAGVLALATFAILLRLAIDHLVGPLVLGRAVHLDPVVVIFAFLAGGALFGILGVLLAVPVAASIKLGLAYVYGEQGPGEPG